MKAGLYIVEDSQISEKADILESSRDSRLVDVHNALSGSIFSVKEYFASCRFINLCQKIEYGRLSGAVRSDQPHDLPVKDLHIEIIDRCQSAEIDTQFLHIKDRCLSACFNMISHWKHLLSL